MVIKSWVALASVTTGALLLGVTTAAVREIDVSPTAAAFWRLAIPLPLLALWLVRVKPTQGMRLLPEKKNAMPLFVAGFFFAGDLFFWHLALIHTTLGNATFLANLSSLWVPLIGLIFLGEYISRNFVLGLALALSGALLLARHSLTVPTADGLGDVYGLLTGFFFCGYLLALDRCRVQMSTTQTLYYSSTVAAILLLPAALLLPGPWLPSTPAGWLPLFALGLLAHLLGQGLVAFGIRRLMASTTAMVLCLEGIGAMTVGVLFYLEPRNGWDLLAVAALIIGIGIARRPRAA